MNDSINETSEELMVRLQEGIPIVAEPFEKIGTEIGLKGDHVIAVLSSLFERGKARRFGGVFDVRRLGYTSVLCAAIIPDDVVDDVAENIAPCQGITHSYLRTSAEDLHAAPPVRGDGLVMPNLWFTLSSLGESFDDDFQTVRDAVAPHTLFTLPAVKRFKVNVILDPRQRKTFERVPSLAITEHGCPVWDGVVRSFSVQEKRVIRSLQNLPVTARPFEQVALATGYAAEDLYVLLKKWKDDGIVKRIGLILKHRNVGFTANGMCVWRVSDRKAEAVGRMLAARAEVTHCYQRRMDERFPYNLYAMIHTDTVDATRALFSEISDYAGLRDGLVFISTKEYKKTSMELFSHGG